MTGLRPAAWLALALALGSHSFAPGRPEGGRDAEAGG